MSTQQLHIVIIDTFDNTLLNVYENASVDAIHLKFSGSDDKYQPLMASELMFDMLVKDAADGKYLHLFTGSETRYKVQLQDITDLENIITIWEGFLLPDIYSEPYTNGAFFVSFSATDGLGRIKNKYLASDFYTTTKSVTAIIAECLKSTGLSLPISIAPALENAIVNLTVDQLEINGVIFSDNSKKLTAYTILENIVTSLGCKLFQWESRWFIVGLNRMGIDSGIVYDISAPTVPALVSEISKTATTATIAWNASTDNVAVAGYKIYKDTVYYATTSNLQYTVSGLVASTSYTFTVTAFDTSNNESATSTALYVTTAATTDTTAPAVPTGLVVDSVTYNSVSLSWTANVESDLVAYKVYKDDVYVKTAYANNITITGLNESSAYAFKILAYDTSFNESALSTEVSTTTTASPIDIIPPTVPGNIRSSSLGSTMVTILWNASTDNVAVTGYRVYRSDGSEFPLVVTLGNVLEFNDSGLTAATNYTYKITALDAAGNESGYSVELTIKTSV